MDWLSVLPCEEKTFKNWTSMNQRFLHLTSQTLMNKLKHVHEFMCSFKTEKRKHNRKSDQAKKWKHSIMYDFWLNAQQMLWILVFSNFRYFSTTLQGHTAMHVTKLLQYFFAGKWLFWLWVCNSCRLFYSPRPRYIFVLQLMHLVGGKEHWLAWMGASTVRGYQTIPMAQWLMTKVAQRWTPWFRWFLVCKHKYTQIIHI